MVKFLLIDDDAVFTTTVGRSLIRRGFEASIVRTGAEAASFLATNTVDIIIIDLKLESENGLQLIKRLKTQRPSVRICMMTGYASIATAVTAIKWGAEQYLPKPATADDILRVMKVVPAPQEDVLSALLRPLNPERLKWEHIQRILSEQSNNVSETARMLGMHRRTLQRILAKRPVHEHGQL